jgi:DNA-binding PadR family transcriptional regulator
LKDKPKHGYEIIQGFEDRLSGYRPSPGSVYPTLQMLEEGGFVTGEEIDGKKVYTITEAGLKLLEERRERPVEETPGMKQNVELMKSLGKLAASVMEASRNSEEDTKKQIGDILDKARRDVYAILAEA